MIKLSKLSDYAIVVLGELARRRGQQMTATLLSVSTKLPEPTVAKVLKLLSKQSIIQSSRGANGGYVLERDPTQITVRELIIALEGPLAITACADDNLESSCCGIEHVCPMRGGWQRVNVAISNALDSLNLNDLFLSPSPKFDLKSGSKGK